MIRKLSGITSKLKSGNHRNRNSTGEGYVTGSKAKKGANDEIFMEHGRYTTCDHHDHPHFYMQLTRAKVRPKKNVVTGPAYLVVEDVPLPLAVPFFFLPVLQQLFFRFHHADLYGRLQSRFRSGRRRILFCYQ